MKKEHCPYGNDKAEKRSALYHLSLVLKSELYDTTYNRTNTPAFALSIEGPATFSWYAVISHSIIYLIYTRNCFG